MNNQRIHGLLLITALVILIWSGLWPKDRWTWLAEVLPVMIGAVLLTATYRRFPLTTLNYTLIWIFSIILMIGGHWTYAEVPIGNWARDALGLSRNHFDRLGHFFQGVIPAMLARELLLRTSPLRRGKWLFTICTCIAVAISAAYEMFEWQYAVIFGGQQAEDFLGSQGDVWDAQKDMALAFCGAFLSQLLLAHRHDRQLMILVATTSSPTTVAGR